MNWKFVAVVLFGLGVLLFGFQAEAVDGFSGNLSNGISVGYIKTGSAETGSLSWRPDFKSGPWGLGVDINVPLGNNKPDGYQSLVFRYVEYDDGQKGLRYGFLEQITWGHGLLVKNYSTRTGGPLILNNDQTGFKGYYNFDNYGVNVLNTWSHLYGARVTETYSGITFGQGYIVDADGVNVKQTNGTVRSFPSQAGFEVDATLPMSMGFNGYAEAATLNNFGKGVSAGIDWKADFLTFAAMFDAGYRSMSANFAPGFFGVDYEINPTDLASVGASSRNGYFAEFSGIMSDYLKLQALYEAYQGTDPSLMAQADSKPREDVTLSAYYRQPKFTDFQSLSLEQGAVIGARVGYKVNPYTTVITHYKKAYNPVLGKVEETQFYEVEISF